jgi:hypothetical protein
MNPIGWLRWLNERARNARRPPRRKPVLRVIEGGRKQGDVKRSVTASDKSLVGAG